MRGWLFGTVDGNTSGIIPANYVKILGKKVVENQNQEGINTNKRISPPQKTIPKTDLAQKPSYSMEELFSDS